MSYESTARANVEDLYRNLATGPDGLTSQEASLRLRRYGPNILPSGRKVSTLGKFLIQFANLFNVLLILASILSLTSGVVYHDTGSLRMGLAILAVVFLNTFFSLFQERRAERAVQAITHLIPTRAKVVRDCQAKEVTVAEVVPGDVVVLEEGDRVPADLRLTSAFEVTIDNALLTGESEPQRRFATMTPEMIISSLTDYQNILFAGTTMVTGIARGIVLSTGKETQFGRIVSMSDEIKEPPSRLEKEINYTAKINLFLALLAGTIFFIIAVASVKLVIIDGILFAIGVMISLVPEGFQLTVSLSLALTALAMSRQNVVVKRLSSVETLGSVAVLCVDKTGTITSGEMMVQKVWTAGRVFEITGDGYGPEGFVTIDGRRMNPAERACMTRLFEVAAFCNNAKLNPPSDRIGRWTVLGDPTDGAFLVFAGKGDFNVSQALAENPRIGLVPFDSQRRMMTSVHRSPEGKIVAYTKGALPEVLAQCTTIFRDNSYLPLTDEDRMVVTHQMDEFASEGYRVLAMAAKVLSHEPEHLSPEIEHGFTLLGLAALLDPPRPKMEAAVREARGAGIKVIMLTGDNELTAETIAKKTDIITSPDYSVISGGELASMGDEELNRILDKQEVVFARVTPAQKLRIVQTLKSKGETVAITGDGVNDAPALREADVGVAMGVGGTDVARESADMVLLDNNFISIVEGIKQGRAMFSNLRKFVYYVFTHNWAELVTFVAFVLLGIPLPLSIVQVLAIDLGMDVLPSLSLIMEPPTPRVMKEPPRSAGSRLIDAPMLLRALYVGLVMSVGSLLWAFTIWMGGGWTFGQKTVPNLVSYTRGTTVVMAGIIAAQLGNLFSARTGVQSAFKLSPSRNKWLFIGLLAQLCVMTAIIYVPFLQPIFGTSALSPLDWLVLYTLAPLVLLLEEIRKLFGRRKASLS